MEREALNNSQQARCSLVVPVEGPVTVRSPLRRGTSENALVSTPPAGKTMVRLVTRIKVDTAERTTARFEKKPLLQSNPSSQVDSADEVSNSMSPGVELHITSRVANEAATQSKADAMQPQAANSLLLTTLS